MSLCSWIMRINIIKMFLLHQALYRLNVILSKFQRYIFFKRNRKNNPKMCVEPQKTSNKESNPEKEVHSRRRHAS